MNLAESAFATGPQLLTSAIVYVTDKMQRSIECRALLDTCATVNFITEAFLKKLGVPSFNLSMPVGAINDTITVSKAIARITIQSTRDNFQKELTCLTIPSITKLIPSEMFPRDAINIPANIKLADPNFHEPRSVDLLIGSGATLSLFCVGQINLSKDGRDLYLQKTRLGWVIAGSAPIQAPSQITKCFVTDLETQIAKFWTMEEVAVDKFKSDEENKSEAHFVETVSRDKDGRYIVRLPFRSNGKQLGDSRAIALKRFAALERKLNAKPELKTEYARVIDEYVSLNHMTLVENPDDGGYYMPHHEVIKESSNTTKVRVVFDASAKTSNGVSLNDVLMVGPTIQARLFEHLVRFRTYKYVLTADIEKMYRQVLVHEDDRHYQRIFWRNHGKIETYQLNTLTFGVSSSPFLAIRAVQKLADDERHDYPRAAQILTNHLYVDDLLTGADTIAEARSIRDEIISTLARGGFAIRQWASNNERVIEDLEASALHANVILHADQSLKTLGIAWNTRDDIICYTARPIEVADRVTKRNILSEIAKIFDPMGLLGPIVLYAKKLMQDVWRCGAHWDESVPQSIHTEWSEFSRQLGMINRISFDRKLLVDDHRDIQIHGFCDASIVGYGACVYLRSRGKRRAASVKLICAKSRVAPLKTVTIPRLELCGALLLARLYREVSEALNMRSHKQILWCDSTIVLHWLRTPPHLLKTFVANRVSQIQELTSTIEWRHVKSEDNPADALSRGQLPNAFVNNQTWKSGPPWLIKDESKWPQEIARITEIPELKGNTCLLTNSIDIAIFERYSSYSKLLRIIAYCLRFRPGNNHTGTLCAKEINEAEIRVLKTLQAVRFPDEIQELKSKGSTSKPKLTKLNPFLDDDGLMRVGGRLQGSRLTFSQKHPILLPSRQQFTDIIIREFHEKHFHAGIQTTLCALRQRFWLCDGRNQVRKIVRSCTRCFRFTADAIQYKMGNLPAARVRESVPFTNTGVDFCGPFYVKEKKFRNRGRIKVYVCVFVCMAIKAIHLELVSDLSSDGFLAALRRFVARRGLPEHIYSDNGTNFVGANKQLKELYSLLNSEEHVNQVNNFASQHRINWHFIPPVAPHFGGLWEASVKLFKHHFRRVVGDSLFTFEELNTFVIEIEGILNSRPITSLSSDPNDMLVLTPAHYLIGKPLTTLPEGDLSFVPVNRLSTWQHISKVRQDFWARWSLEYLNELQMRHKWAKDGPILSSGTIVLIKDKNLPCTQWALGRVTTLFTGKDGIVRAAAIKTATGEIKRAVTHLCPLPMERLDHTTAPPEQK